MSEETIEQSEGTFDGAGGARLFERWWRPAGDPTATVLIVHGYGEHSGRYGWVGSQLARRGYAVYTFDLRGHGQSSGERWLVRSFQEHLADLDVFRPRGRGGEPGRPLFLLGHSMGGTIAALYTLDRRPDLRGLILASAGLKPGTEVPPILQRLAPLLAALAPRLPALKVDPAVLSRDPAVVQAYAADPLGDHRGMPARTGVAFVRAIAQIQALAPSLALPVLILHGTADRLTNIEGSKEFYAQARAVDKTLTLYDGFYHELLNEPEREQVLAAILAWLAAH